MTRTCKRRRCGAIAAILTLGTVSPYCCGTVPNVDTYCGPRCVHFVLQCFHKHVELNSLIDEIQGSASEQSSSLLAIESSLRRRELFTSAISVSENADIVWPYPAIVHLAGGKGAEGHYVVELPSSESKSSLVWMGISGAHPIDRRQLASARSGAVLLTAPEPILDISTAVRTLPLSTKTILLVAAGTICTSVFAALFVWKQSNARLERCTDKFHL